jgi:hypothetical protein
MRSEQFKIAHSELWINTIEPKIKYALKNIWNLVKKLNNLYYLVCFNNPACRLNGNILESKIKEALNNIGNF